MHILDLVFSDLVFSLGVTLLVAAGGLLVSDEFKRFGAAKVCFYLAAVLVCGRVLMWSVFTSETTLVRFFATFLAFGVVGVCLTEAVRATNHRENTVSVTQQEAPKPAPPIQQTSQGNNSPNTNITGNNNTVNNTVTNTADPKVLAKIDEIKKILLAQQGDKADSAKLLAKYPLGYVIFDVENLSSVFPYKTRGLSRYDFDWSSVSVVEDRPDHLLITMPDIKEKLTGTTITGTSIGAAKKIGPVSTNFFTDGVVTAKEEILAIRDSGIILLIGFVNATPPKK